MKQKIETRDELKKQLRHADRLATVGQLAAGIAHELNGPLGNILGYAQLLSKNPDLPDQVYQDLDNIVRLSLYSREIVRKMMFFSRTMPPNIKNVNLNDMVEESLYFTEPYYTKSRVRVIRKLSKDLPTISADPSQIHQVMVNLLVNAVQAMEKKGGQIIVETMFSGAGTVVFTIEDTGTGMEPDALKQCFMPFFTTKDVGKGTGLGLSVVHGIVTAHGGTIEGESTVNKGSLFRIVFPAADSGRGDA